MVITAKFASVCPACNARIEVGSKVEWSKGEKARHVSCGGSSAAAAPSSSPTTAAKPGCCTKCGKACKPQYRTCFACSGKEPSNESVRRTYRRRFGWDGIEGSPSYYTSGMYDEES
jgi:hypothetical protein